MNEHPEQDFQGQGSRWSLYVVLFVALIVIGLSLFVSRFQPRQTYAPTEHPAVGKRLQQIDLQPLTGATEPLTNSDLRSRAWLLNFWGTWCPPCRAEMPHLVALHRELRRNPTLMIVSVSCDDAQEFGELKHSTEEYLERNGFDDLPTYADPRGVTRQQVAYITGMGDSFAYPTTVVVDGYGTIHGVWIGVGSGGAEETVKEQTQLLTKIGNEMQSLAGDQAP